MKGLYFISSILLFYLVLSQNIEIQTWSSSGTCQGTATTSVSYSSGQCTGAAGVSTNYVCSGGTLTLNSWTSSSTCSGTPTESSTVSQSCTGLSGTSTKYTCSGSSPSHSSSQKMVTSMFLLLSLLSLYMLI